MMVRSRGTAGECVIGDGSFHCAAFHVLYAFPFGTGESHSGEALTRSEDDAAVLVVPGIRFILAEDRELDPVDGFELIQGEAKRHGRQAHLFQPAPDASHSRYANHSFAAIGK